MYCKFESLNGSVKEVDLSGPGWTFVSSRCVSSRWHFVEVWKTDWIAIRRHCGGLLILRRRYNGTHGPVCEEMTLHSAKEWLRLNRVSDVVGYPELESMKEAA